MREIWIRNNVGNVGMGSRLLVPVLFYLQCTECRQFYRSVRPSHSRAPNFTLLQRILYSDGSWPAQSLSLTHYGRRATSYIASPVIYALPKKANEHPAKGITPQASCVFALHLRFSALFFLSQFNGKELLHQHKLAFSRKSS